MTLQVLNKKLLADVRHHFSQLSQFDYLKGTLKSRPISREGEFKQKSKHYVVNVVLPAQVLKMLDLSQIMVGKHMLRRLKGRSTSEKCILSAVPFRIVLRVLPDSSDLVRVGVLSRVQLTKLLEFLPGPLELMVSMPVLGFLVSKVRIVLVVGRRHEEVGRSQVAHDVVHGRFNHLGLEMLDHVHHCHQIDLETQQLGVLDQGVSLEQPHVLVGLTRPLDVLLYALWVHVVARSLNHALLDVHPHYQTQLRVSGQSNQQLSLRAPQLNHRPDLMFGDDLADLKVPSLVHAHLHVGHDAGPALHFVLLHDNCLLLLEHSMLCGPPLIQLA